MFFSVQNHWSFEFFKAVSSMRKGQKAEVMEFQDIHSRKNNVISGGRTSEL
jgi:hypothetical protein